MTKRNETYDGVVELLAANRPSKTTGVTPRDSDKELIVQYLQIHLGANLSLEQMNLIRSVNFESIRRTRAKLQEHGEYLGSPEVMAKRRRKGYQIEHRAHDADAEELNERIGEN